VNNRNVDIHSLRQEFRTHELVARSIQEDHKILQGGTLLYNVDFSVLYSYLWPTAPEAIPPFKDYGKSVCGNLIEIASVKPGFSLVFTGPSLWELLDQIYHQIQHIKSTVHTWSGELSTLKSRLSSSASITTDEALQAIDQVGIVIDKVYFDRIRQPIQKFVEILKDKAMLQGVGDFIDTNFAASRDYSSLVKALYEKMCHERPQFPGETRHRIDRQFHYKVDAINIAASNFITDANTDTSMFFATDSRLRNRYCREKGRNPLVPSYWISSLLLKRAGYLQNEQDFLRSWEVRSRSLYDSIGCIEKTEDISPFLARDISDYFSRYASPLRTAGQEAVVEVANLERDQLLEALNDKKKFTAHFDKAEAELVAGARQISQLAPDLLEDGLYEMLEDEPQIDRLRRGLRI
jgi:hypothetical protein